MIKNYFDEEYKAKNKNYTEYESYLACIQADIDRAKQIKKETIAEIMDILELCNAVEIRELRDLIYGAVNELEYLGQCGR